MTERRIAAAILALAAIGFCREGYFHFFAEPRFEQRPFPGEPLDAAFAKLRTLLPASGEVGYVTDEPILLSPGNEIESAKGRFLKMQYSVAPVVLRYGDDRASVVVANVADPAQLNQVLAAHGLVAVARAGPATAVARPAK